ncbi:MAG: hypothetical protein ACI8XO_004870 [Verrucomicrobiales bacterium]|jgi:hypothetical protein
MGIVILELEIRQRAVVIGKIGATHCHTDWLAASGHPKFPLGSLWNRAECFP